MKQIYFSLLTFILAFSITMSTLGADDMKNPKIVVIVDGTELKFNIQPQMINGKVMAELRTLVDHIDAKINWAEKTKTVTITNFLGKQIILQIGNKRAYMNGEECDLDLEPQIIDNRTFIPLRSFSTYAGGIYIWYDEKNTSNIYFGRG